MLNELEFYKNIAESAVDLLLTAYYHKNCYMGMYDDEAYDRADKDVIDKIDTMSVNVLDAMEHGEDAYAAYCEDEEDERRK